jgi:hypothetical protein
LHAPGGTDPHLVNFRLAPGQIACQADSLTIFFRHWIDGTQAVSQDQRKGLPVSDLIEMLLLFPLIAILYQFYRFSVKRKDADRQKKCQLLGITYATLGIFCLVFRTPFFIFSGLILLMFGFRLIAYGLDRINKTTFIDRFEEDD